MIAGIDDRDAYVETYDFGFALHLVGEGRSNRPFAWRTRSNVCIISTRGFGTSWRLL